MCINASLPHLDTKTYNYCKHKGGKESYLYVFCYSILINVCAFVYGCMGVWGQTATFV